MNACCQQTIDTVWPIETPIRCACGNVIPRSPELVAEDERERQDELMDRLEDGQ